MKKSDEYMPWSNYLTPNANNLVYPDYSVYKHLETTAESHLNAKAYNYFGKKVSFKKYLKQIDRCARAFKKLGVQKGEYVSICMANTPEAIISFYALNKIGAVANMIHPLSAENEIKYYLNVSDSKYVVTIDASFNKINHIVADTKIKNIILVAASKSMPKWLEVGYDAKKFVEHSLEYNSCTIKWKKFMKLGKKYEEEIIDEGVGEDVCAILYSGGTSGDPKGIMLTNYNFNAEAINSVEACTHLEVGDRCLAILPIFHAFGLGVCIHTVQSFGGCSVLIPQFNAKQFHKLLKKYKANIIIGVPTLFEAMLNNKELQKFDFSKLKLLISGGDNLSVSLKKKVDDFIQSHGANIQVREGYGLTESTGASCLTPYSDYRAGSIGIPYPGMYYKIVKPGTNKELKYGKEGEIIISGPTVMKGYLKDQELTKKTLIPDKNGRIWLHTGDVASMDEDGFVYFKQRIKRMIVSSGYNVYPQYIENIIESHPDVSYCCVIGIPHPYKVQVAKAFIVLKSGVPESDKTLESIKELCKKNLARYSWPSEYEFRDKLPKTLVGKVAYHKLELEEEKKLNK